MGADAGAIRQRVFHKNVQQFDLDTAVSILIDFSGSMGDSKMTHAIVSGAMLNDAIAKIGVPVEVLGFTEWSTQDFYIFKTFKRKVTNEELIRRMCTGTHRMGGNADGEAILWAYDRLVRQPNKRKLLIVLSDGQPAGGNGDIVNFTKSVVNKIQDEHRAEIYGIGIQSNAVKNYYKHHQVIHRANELEGAILNVIKKHILK